MNKDIFLLNNSDDIKELENKIQFCFLIIDEYRKNADFDPLRFLNGNTNKADQLFSVCVDYIQNIQNATEAFNKARRGCL